jgi:hypothetical protein
VEAGGRQEEEQVVDVGRKEGKRVKGESSTVARVMVVQPTLRPWSVDLLHILDTVLMGPCIQQLPWMQVCSVKQNANNTVTVTAARHLPPTPRKTPTELTLVYKGATGGGALCAGGGRRTM